MKLKNHFPNSFLILFKKKLGEDERKKPPENRSKNNWKIKRILQAIQREVLLHVGYQLWMVIKNKKRDWIFHLLSAAAAFAHNANSAWTNEKWNLVENISFSFFYWSCTMGQLYEHDFYAHSVMKFNL